MVILVVLIIVNKRRRPVVEPAPEQKFLIVRIDSTQDNSSKVFTLEENQVVVVFRKDSLIDISKTREFTIGTYVSNKGIKMKDHEFRMLHFYIFNMEPIINLSLKIDQP